MAVKVYVEVIGHHLVLVTMRPSWLARLFGAKTRQGEAMCVRHEYATQRYKWRWSMTDRPVPEHVERAIETWIVEDLPTARLLSDNMLDAALRENRRQALLRDTLRSRKGTSR